MIVYDRKIKEVEHEASSVIAETNMARTENGLHPQLWHPAILLKSTFTRGHLICFKQYDPNLAYANQDEAVVAAKFTLDYALTFVERWVLSEGTFLTLKRPGEEHTSLSNFLNILRAMGFTGGVNLSKRAYDIMVTGASEEV